MKSVERICLERHLKTFFPYLNQGEVLDIGSGTISYQNFLFLNQKVLTLDIDKETKPDVVGDAHKLPFLNERFENVVGIELLEHCYNPQKVVDEIYRVLKENGQVIISTRFINQIHGDTDYFRFSEDGLKYLFRKFKNVEVFPTGNRFHIFWMLMTRGKWAKPLRIFNPLVAYFDFSPINTSLNIYLPLNKFKTKFPAGYILTCMKGSDK